MAHGLEVHVGDIGTLYRVLVEDEDGPFDPSDADTKQLIFKLPDGSVVIKDASVEAADSPPSSWYLTYQVEPAAGPGSPPAEFHMQAGRMQVQAYLEYADGSEFHSDIKTKDIDGHELRVYPNLDDQ